MNNVSIFEGYMTEEERSSAIESLKSSNTLEQILDIYEMVEIQRRQAYRDAELKVLTECGTYADYAYLIQEADEAAAANAANAGKSFGDWLANILQSIINVFKSIFGIKDEAQAPVPEKAGSVIDDLVGVAPDIAACCEEVNFNGDKVQIKNPGSFITKLKALWEKITGTTLGKIATGTAVTAVIGTATVVITGKVAKKEATDANEEVSPLGKVVQGAKELLDKPKQYFKDAAADEESIIHTIWQGLCKILEGIKKVAEFITKPFKKNKNNENETVDEIKAAGKPKQQAPSENVQTVQTKIPEKIGGNNANQQAPQTQQQTTQNDTNTTQKEDTKAPEKTDAGNTTTQSQTTQNDTNTEPATTQQPATATQKPENAAQAKPAQQQTTQPQPTTTNQAQPAATQNQTAAQEPSYKSLTSAQRKQNTNSVKQLYPKEVKTQSEITLRQGDTVNMASNGKIQVHTHHDATQMPVTLQWRPTSQGSYVLETAYDTEAYDRFTSIFGTEPTFESNEDVFAAEKQELTNLLDLL